ncbi:MAG: DUF5103 domain-containing protein [Flavobacteriales bacterium]|nr:DUF5103 domain-containing protein [Flavobacteriales bacterium]
MRFDDFSPDTENLSFTVVNYNAGWLASDLSPASTSMACRADFVASPRQSFNTLKHYLEYELGSRTK